jgi:hypothetical protein
MESLTRRTHELPRAEAEALAVRALGFLAANPERLGRFLAETGLGPDNLRASADDPGFLPAVLQYLAANETILTAFASEESVDPSLVIAARTALSIDKRER